MIAKSKQIFGHGKKETIRIPIFFAFNSNNLGFHVIYLGYKKKLSYQQFVFHFHLYQINFYIFKKKFLVSWTDISPFCQQSNTRKNYCIVIENKLYCNFSFIYIILNVFFFLLRLFPVIQFFLVIFVFFHKMREKRNLVNDKCFKFNNLLCISKTIFTNKIIL